MNIQLTLDFDVEVDDSKARHVLNEAYMLKYFLEETIPEHLKGVKSEYLINALKSVDLIVRD